MKCKHDWRNIVGASSKESAHDFFFYCTKCIKICRRNVVDVKEY